MALSAQRRRIRRYVVAALIGLIGLGVAVRLRPDPAAGPPDVEALIALLRVPGNKATVVGHVVPGGEIIEYSWPMKRLIEVGNAARGPLHRRLGDAGIRNEVALVLGAIGDETTVPLLIEAFPEPDVPDTPFDYSKPDPDRVSVICFAHALNGLTGQSIGLTRWGTEFGPGTRQAWRDWWARSHKTFWVRDDRPGPNRSLKPLSEILAQLDRALGDDDPAVRRAAATAYAQLGPQATPSVSKLIAALRDASPEVREAAASAFSSIGPDGAAAVPALLDLMRHDPVENVRGDAELSLARIGEAAVAPLVELLTHEAAEIRRRAIGAIGEMTPTQKWILPTFRELAKDPHPEVRRAALGYMEIIDSEDPAVFQDLLTGLGDPSPVVRRGCAYHFWRMGPRAEPATGALVGRLRDTDAGVRREAINALLKIRSLTRDHVPLLIDLLRDESWMIRADAADGLSQIGPDARAAVGALRAGLTDPQGNVRWWSAIALGKIGPDAKAALPALVGALADPEDLVRSSAEEALKKIDPVAAARAGVR